MSRRWIWIALLATLVSAVGWAQGEPGMGGGGFGGGLGGGMGGRGGWRGGGGRRMQAGQQQEDPARIWEDLGLNKDQLDKVHQIFDDERKSSADDRRNLQDARRELDKMMRVDQPDRAAIEKQIESMERLRTELQKSSTWAMLDARALLTPQQRSRLDEKLAQRQDARPERGGFEGGPGGGGGAER